MRGSEGAAGGFSGATTDETILDPGHEARPLYWLGELLESRGQLADALTPYKQAAALAKDAHVIEWTMYQFAAADLLFQIAETDNSRKELFDEADRLADEILQAEKDIALSSIGFATIELRANCSWRRGKVNPTPLVERYVPSAPPTEAEQAWAYWRLRHLRSWWASFKEVLSPSESESERAAALQVRDGCRTLGDPALEGHGDGIFGIWTFKQFNQLLGDPRRERGAERRLWIRRKRPSESSRRRGSIASTPPVTPTRWLDSSTARSRNCSPAPPPHNGRDEGSESG